MPTFSELAPTVTSDKAMTPLQITAHTPHGVVLARPWGIALDGLLASVLWQRHKWSARAAGNWITYQHDQPPLPLNLPLAVCGDPDTDPDWHWMATFADLHPHATSPAHGDPDVRWRTSRTDRSRLQALTPHIGTQVVSDSSGRYQRRLIPGPAHPATTLTWRAVGDAAAIEELLTDLPSIGKHRGTGEGRVSRWEIHELPVCSRWSAGHEHEPSILGRPTPQRCISGADVATGPLAHTAVRPPYLHPSTRASAFHPAR